MSADAIFGLAGCGLLGLAVLGTALRLQRMPVRVRYAVALALAFAVFVPIGGFPAVAYVRGVTGDLSITTLVLAGAACIAQLTGRTLIGGRELRTLFRLLAIAALFLYPLALGWTQFDPYALGYGSAGLVTVLLMVALAAWRARLDLVVLVIVLAAGAYLAGAYESRNLWDYLLDPLVSVYAFVRILASLRHRPSGELTETVRSA